jgi:hypothetical protein
MQEIDSSAKEFIRCYVSQAAEPSPRFIARFIASYELFGKPHLSSCRRELFGHLGLARTRDFIGIGGQGFVDQLLLL